MRCTYCCKCSAWYYGLLCNCLAVHLALEGCHVLLSAVCVDDLGAAVDKAVDLFAVQVRNDGLDRLIALIVAALCNGHGLAAVQNRLCRGDVAVKADEDGLGICRVVRCCTRCRDRAVVVVAGDDSQTFRMALHDALHADGRLVGYRVGILHLVCEEGAAFSAASAGAALAIGGLIGCVFTFVYFWLRGAIGFEKSFESVPQGFIQMIAPILILTFAWTLCSFTRNAMYSADFVSNAMANVGDLRMFLPAIIFIIGAAIGFATGTSWGTIGIMAPIVVSVFNYDVEPVLCTIGLAAACSGGVMGDHCSPISDTTIMASAGAHCYHLNHVFTQIPYALTVAGVSFVSFILAGLIQNVFVNLLIAVALMVGTLLVIRAIVAKKHAGIFAEMAEANKALAK